MKKLNYLLSLGALLSLFFVMSCGGDDDGNPSEEELQLQKLSKTWVLSKVTNDSEDVTATWTGFTLTIPSATAYTTSNSVETSVWPVGGSWAFDGAGTDNVNINRIVRDGAVNIDIVVNDDGTSLELTFSIPDAGSGGRVAGLTGPWVFTMTAQ